MERGTLLHTLAEHYLINKIQRVPKQLLKIKPELMVLKRYRPIVEQFWGVSSKWKPMKYGWLVAKTDAAVPPRKRFPILVIVDHKSGRMYPEHIAQAKLYAAVGFGLYPRVDCIEVEFFYIDIGLVVPYRFTRGQLKYQVKYWMDQGHKFMAQTKFLATPTEDACSWCGFRSDKKLANGTKGPCNEWKVLRNLRR
jgi:hypothetical protein